MGTAWRRDGVRILHPTGRGVLGTRVLDCNAWTPRCTTGAPPTLAGVDNDCNGYILGLEQLGGGCPGDLNRNDLVSMGHSYFGSSGFLEISI